MDKFYAALAKRKYAKNIDKDGTFTRPKGWEDKLKTKDARTTAKEVAEKRKKESGSEKRKSAFESIRKMFSSNK